MNAMADLGNSHFTSSPFTPAAEAAPAAPPPPPEVKVRTMRSDLDSMAKSGGGAPRFESIKVEGLVAARTAAAGAVQRVIPEARKSSGSWAIVVAIIAVILLGAAGYFVYTAFFANSEAPATTPPATGPAASNGASNNGQTGGPAATAPAGGAATASTPTSTPASAPFTHVSLFKKPADQVLTLTLSLNGAAASAADLATFNQKLATVLTTADKTATLIEIDAKDTAGNDVSIGDLLSAANELVIDPAALAAHFNADATFFVYRDKNGFWPGYVLSLRTGDNWLFSSADVAKLETSPSIANFFLQDVGKPSPDGFTDSTISGVSVRVLPYLDAPIPSYFTYGWTKGNLILSTSQSGFSQAVSRL